MSSRVSTSRSIRECETIKFVTRSCIRARFSKPAARRAPCRLCGRMKRHRRARHDKRTPARNRDRHAYRMPAAEHKRSRRLAHSREKLGYGKPASFIAADCIYQHEQSVHRLALLDGNKQRQYMLVFCRFAAARQFVMPSICPIIVMQCNVKSPFSSQPSRFLLFSHQL